MRHISSPHKEKITDLVQRYITKHKLLSSGEKLMIRLELIKTEQVEIIHEGNISEKDAALEEILRHMRPRTANFLKSFIAKAKYKIEKGLIKAHHPLDILKKYSVSEIITLGSSSYEGSSYAGTGLPHIGIGTLWDAALVASEKLGIKFAFMDEFIRRPT